MLMISAITPDFPNTLELVTPLSHIPRWHRRASSFYLTSATTAPTQRAMPPLTFPSETSSGQIAKIENTPHANSHVKRFAANKQKQKQSAVAKKTSKPPKTDN
jgi:hypothetical protein